MGTFCFRSIADLGRDVRSWLDELPQDLEVVVGIPRSGLLVASLISLLAAMSRAHLILTDSGEVQEEAPSLGIPILALRDEAASTPWKICATTTPRPSDRFAGMRATRSCCGR